MFADRWLRLLFSWLALPALLLLAGILLYRRWYRTFPFFLVYVVGAELIGLVRLAASTAPLALYTRIYWVSDTFLVAFAFLATYELFFRRLFPNFYKTSFYRYLFPLTGILLTVLASVVALWGGHSSVLKTTVLVYEFLRAMVLFFFMTLMLVMGRRWSRQEFGIAFGFGLDVSLSLALSSTWSHVTNRSAALGRISVVAYDIACMVWLYCFWAAPRASIALNQGSSEKFMEDAGRSEKVLKDFLTSGKPKP